jgi:hypothetical protein
MSASPTIKEINPNAQSSPEPSTSATLRNRDAAAAPAAGAADSSIGGDGIGGESMM